MSSAPCDRNEWDPVSVLPNVLIRDAIEDQYAALVPPTDLRVAALGEAPPALASNKLLSGFARKRRRRCEPHASKMPISAALEYTGDGVAW